jgi:hypothetical protein
MGPADKHLHPVTAQLQIPKPNSAILAGQSDHLTSTDIDQEPPLSPAQKEQLIVSINNIFGLLRVNYHNQFLKAYPDLETLNQGKRLWLKLLAQYPPKRILWATEQAMISSEYLPSVAEIHKRLTASLPESLGMPTAHAAYVEACRAPHPKSAFDWSHPAVYWAGRATDWQFLASQPEKTTFPVFTTNYSMLCQRVVEGENLEQPLPPQLPEKISEPELSKEQKKLRLQSLRQQYAL